MGRTPWNTVLVLGLCLLVFLTGTGAQKPKIMKAATKTPRPLSETATPTTSSSATEELLTTIKEHSIVRETVQGPSESSNSLSDSSIVNMTVFSPDPQPATTIPFTSDSIPQTTQTQLPRNVTGPTSIYLPTANYEENNLTSTPEKSIQNSLLNYENSDKDQQAETIKPWSLSESVTPTTSTAVTYELLMTFTETVQDTTESTNLLSDSSIADISAFSPDTESATAFPISLDTTPQTTQTLPPTTFTDTTSTFNSTPDYNENSLTGSPEQSTKKSLLNENVSEDITTTFPFDTTLQYLTSTPLETKTETGTFKLFLTNTTSKEINIIFNTTDSSTQIANFPTTNTITTTENIPDTTPIASTKSNNVIVTTETFPTDDPVPTTTSSKSNDGIVITETFPIDDSVPTTTSTKSNDGMVITETFTTDDSVPTTTSIKSNDGIEITETFTIADTVPTTTSTKSNDVTVTTQIFLTDDTVPTTTNTKINDVIVTTETFPADDTVPTTSSTKFNDAVTIIESFSDSNLTTTISTTDSGSSIAYTPSFSTITSAETLSDISTTDNTTLSNNTDSPQTTTFTNPPTTTQVIPSTDVSECDIPLTVNARVSEDVRTLFLFWKKAPNIEADLSIKIHAKPKNCTPFLEGRIGYEDEKFALDIKCFDTRYAINVSAVCAGEIEGEAVSIIIWTPPEEPRNVKVVSKTQNSLSIKWDRPPNKPNSKKIQKFRILVDNITLYDEIITPAYKIEDLESDTNYSVKVSANNGHGWSRWSDESFGKTSQKPLDTQNVKLGSITQTSIEVQWPDYKIYSNDTLFDVYCNQNGTATSQFVTESLSFTITELDSYTNYSIIVRANTSDQSSRWSNQVEARTLPEAPSEPRDLRNVSISNTSIVLEWNEPAFVQEPILIYEVQWTDLEAEEPEITNTGLLTFTIEDLQPYTDYWVDVCAVTKSMRGNVSRIVVTTDIGFPRNPENLSVVDATNTSISITWSEPLICNGPIEYYLVQWENLKDNNSSENTTTDNNFFNIEGLQPYSNYSIRVRAATKKGEGEWSETVIETTKVGIPSNPRDINITDVSAMTIALCWLPPNPFVGPLSYFVEIRQSDTDFKETGVTAENCYEISKLRPYTQYSVRVIAATKAGKGQPSDVISIKTKTAVPSAPRNVTVLSTEQTNLIVCWEEPSPFVGPVLSYYVATKTPKEVGWTRKGTTKETCFTVTMLKPYTEYLIRVRAETEAGKGQFSELVEIKTAIGDPSAPRDLYLSSTTNTSISVSWSDPESPNGPQLTYIVQWSDPRKLDGFFEAKDIKEKFHTIKELYPFTNYSVKVRASTSAGMGPWTNPLDVKTKEGVPFEPRNVTIFSITNSSAKVQWLPPDPVVGVIVNYTIRWSCTDGDKKVFLNYTKKSGIGIGDLLPYTNYTVQVKAATKAGEGLWSQESQFRTLSGVPSSPSIVAASPTSNTSIKLTWSEPDPFRGPIKAYIIRVKTGGNIVRDDESSGREHLVLNLLPDTMYSFQVQAKTGAGPGEWSKKVEARTHIGIPTEPRKVVTSNKTARSISLVWQPPNPTNGLIEKYVVQWGMVGDKKGWTNETMETNFEAEYLIPYTKYYFRVSAETTAGRGPSSKEIVDQTEIAKPSEPTNLTSSASSSSSLLVTWDLPVHPNGPLQSYRVQWRASDRDLDKEEEAMVNETRWTISSLSPYTNYTVKVAASTSVGFGPWTEDVTRTDVAVPFPAHVSSVAVSGPRSISVKWQAVGPFPGPFNTTLEVYRRPGPCEPSTPGNFLKVDALQTTQDTPSKWRLPEQRNVEGLIPHSIYFARVVMETEAGNSDSKDSKDLWTLPDVPGPPAVVEADCKSSSTEAEVRWSPPTFPNGEIEGYMVMYGIKSFEWHEQLVRVNNSCGNQRLKISNLRPEKNYTIKVRAKVKKVSSEGPPTSLGNFCILPAGVPPLGEGSVRGWGSGPHSLTIEWWKDVFSEEMGALVNFAILVGTSVGNATLGTVPEDHPTWGNFTRGISQYYQTTPLNWNPFKKELRDPLSCEEVVSEELKRPLLRCVVGIGDPCYSGEHHSYCNGPLNPDTTYGLKLVAFTRGGFAETDPFFASTGTVPSSSWVGVLVGSLIVVILVGAVIGYVIVLKRKGKLQQVRDILMFRFGKREAPPLPPVEQVLQMETAQLPKSLTVQNFAKHVRIMMSDSHLRFSQEFEALKRNSPKFPCTIAEMDENRVKNRWLNIFPYDHSRVKLLPLGDDPTSDYINANYIPGHSSLREYIATQGPLASTVDDFWRLVWEQSVSMLVMLTQCVERGKNKCEQYWPPPAEAKHYGDLQVRSISESMLSCYTIRMFHLQLGSQERRVKQLHFTHWPDFGCPETPEGLINFVRSVRDHLPRLRPGPILVHCSAGVGRTGTFIAVDRHSQQLPHTDLIDVYGTVMEMRQHRVNMVQTEDQYIYIHLCIEQLINERNQPDDNEYEEAIYSNIGVEHDTGF